jgi:3-deoxy-D-manno-octulosonic-acid transferase
MTGTWRVVYTFIVVPVMWLAFQVVGLLNDKVRRGIRGRANLFAGLEATTHALASGTRVWIHSASMGEFEQGKAIIASLRDQYPGLDIIVTFFSPSGYENSRNYPLANIVSYIPFDTPRNAERFLDIINPDVALFIRYDIWPNHLWALRKRMIPALLVNATMSRVTVRRLPFVKGFYRAVYDNLEEILTVSENDVQAFRLFSLGHPRIMAVGDTRFDQVAARSIEAGRKTILPPDILSGRKVLVAGSCWGEDDHHLVPAFERLSKALPEALLIHVPHEPTQHHIAGLANRFRGRLSFCLLSDIGRYAGEPVIVVDSIGKLVPLYASAHLAYIGGSFGQGIHNVLEAAVFGVPVVFGPRHYNSQEPLQLIDAGGGFVVDDEQSMERTLKNLLEDDVVRAMAGARAAEFVRKHTGTTQRVVARLGPYISQMHGEHKVTS